MYLCEVGRLIDKFTVILRIIAVSILGAVLSGCISSSEGEEERNSTSYVNTDVRNLSLGSKKETDFLKQLESLTTDSLFRLGSKYVINSPVVPDSALMVFMVAVNREDKVRSDTAQMAAITKCYVNTAHVYSTVYRNLTRAYRNLRKAEELCHQYGFDDLLAHVYMNMGVTLSSENTLLGKSLPGTDLETAVDYLRKAYSVAERTGNYEVMDFSIYNMVSGPDIMRNDSTYHYIERYLKTGVSDTDPMKVYLTSVCRGLIAYANGEYSEAHAQFAHRDTANHNVKWILPRLREQAMYFDAVTYEAEGNTTKARELLTEILGEATKRGDLESEMAYNNSLYQFEQEHGKPEIASEHLLNFYRIRERLASMSDEISISEMQLQETLEHFESELNRTRNHERQMRWITWTVCIIAVFTIIILLIILYYSRRRRQYIMALYEKHLNTKPYTSVQAIEESEPAEGAHKNLAETTPDDREDKEEKISPELVKAVVDVMENSREIFDPEFQMARLCALLGSNTTYVSRAVNSYYGKPFKNVLAERRIAEACRRLDNPVDNASLTIEAICLEVGFKSRSAFSVAFKNVTGLTPTEYRKAAQKYMPPK